MAVSATIKKRIAAILLGGSLVSAAGFALIKTSEGVRYTSYPDPGTHGAPWTICYGHTKGVKPYQKATQAQCDQWLKEDTAEAEAYLQTTVTVPLTQGEYNAYVSFIYNAGPANWQISTMRRKLNANDRVGACNQFPHWIYADKRILEGLRVRRYKEQRQCLTFGKTVYVPH